MVYTISLILLAMLATDGNASCRSHKPAHAFEVQQGYPHGRKGYVIDHVCALACGGIDDPSNMQYQTYKDGKAKDRWERTDDGCARMCTPANSTATRQVFNCKSGKRK
jgi:hypothetical protein